MKDFYESAIAEAQSWVGTQEITGNMGFEDPRFEHLLRICKWDVGQAWCAYAAELWWTKPTYSGKSKYWKKMVDLFSAGAVATYNNFKNDDSGLFSVDRDPVPGAVAIWQSYRNGKPHWTGHAGLVEEVGTNEIRTIEGNTNGSGGREGIEVARKTRSLNFNDKSGLVLKGFIKLAEHDK